MLSEKNLKIGGGRGNSKIFRKLCRIVVEMSFKLAHNIVKSHTFIATVYFGVNRNINHIYRLCEEMDWCWVFECLEVRNPDYKQFVECCP